MLLCRVVNGRVIWRSILALKTGKVKGRGSIAQFEFAINDAVVVEAVLSTAS